MLLMRQDHGARHRDPELRCQRIIEELVVCPPPKRVVNHQAPVEHRVLKKGPVKGNVMRNSINDDTVAARFHDFHTAERDEFRGHIFDLEGVDLGDQSSWKGVLHSKEYSDSIHGSLKISPRRGVQPLGCGGVPCAVRGRPRTSPCTLRRANQISILGGAATPRNGWLP